MGENDSEQAAPGGAQADPRIALESSEQIRELALAMVRSARRSIAISGRQLDPRLYDNSEFAEAVKRLALSSRHARVRLLALEARELVSRGHRLIDLAQQLSSFISIRVPSQQHAGFNEAMLVVDERLWIHRRPADLLEGFAAFEDPRQGRELARRFDEIWAQAEVEPSFNRIRL